MQRRRLGTDLPISVALVVATSVGFATWFSRSTMDPGLFDAYYRRGVYRYRVVGRALVWNLYRVLGNPLGNHLPRSTVGSNPGAMFTALVVVNGLCFAGTCYLIHRLIRGLAEPGRTLIFVTLATIVALSGYVVTPYDQLAYLLLLLVVMAADLRPPFDLAPPALTVLAVANRETAFVAVAALLASRWPLQRDRRSMIAIGSGIAGVVAYVALRGAGDGSAKVWDQITLLGNLGRLTGWIGVVLIAAMLWAWWAVCQVSGFTGGPAVRRLWLFSTPYLLVAGLTGYWFEVRLLVPMLLAECWVRARTADGVPGGPHPLGRHRRPHLRRRHVQGPTHR